MPSEWATASVEGTTQRFLPDLINNGIPSELDRDRPVLIACGSGRRASIAAGILADAGYSAIVLHEAGITDLVDHVGAA